jgi:hypothetical protein
VIKTKHPGKTKAERAALDAIGCGNNSPIMSNKVCNSLLSDGRIVELPEKLLPDRFFPVKIRQFEMSIPTHIEWCKWGADNWTEEDERQDNGRQD